MTAKPAGQVFGSLFRLKLVGPQPTGNCFIPEPRSTARAVADTSAIFSKMGYRRPCIHFAALQFRVAYKDEEVGLGAHRLGRERDGLS